MKIFRKIILSLVLSLISSSYLYGYEYSFGASPRSADFHKMFNSSASNKLAQLRRKTKWFRFHPLTYSTRDARMSPTATFRNNAALSNAELTRAAKAMRKHNFRVAIETSLGLGSAVACNTKSSVDQAAQAAADYEIWMLNRLEDKLKAEGKYVERIFIDGPFLRLLSNSVKAFSCGKGRGSFKQGHSMYKSAQIVNKFFHLMQRAFPKAKLHLTINIVNWKQGSIMPHFGTTSYDLDSQLYNFLSIYKKQRGYTIKGFQFDAPYAVISKRGNNSIYEFLERINKFYVRVHKHMGRAFTQSRVYSFIINTLPKEDFYKLGFLPHNYNGTNKYSAIRSDQSVCTLAASKKDRKTSQRTCMLNDYYYYRDSKNYANKMKYYMRNHNYIKRLTNVNLAFASWHSGPKYSITGPGSYLDFFVGYTNNSTGAVLRNVIDRK